MTNELEDEEPEPPLEPESRRIFSRTRTLRSQTHSPGHPIINYRNPPPGCKYTRRRGPSVNPKQSPGQKALTKDVVRRVLDPKQGSQAGGSHDFIDEAHSHQPSYYTLTLLRPFLYPSGLLFRFICIFRFLSLLQIPFFLHH